MNTLTHPGDDTTKLERIRDLLATGGFQVLAELERLTSDRNPRVGFTARKAVIGIMESQASREAGKDSLGGRIDRLLNHSDPKVRIKAVEKITGAKYAPALPALYERLEKEDDDTCVAAMITAIALISRSFRRDLLNKFLKSDSNAVKLAAFEAVMHTEDETSLSTVIPYANHSTREIRDMARRVLAAAGRVRLSRSLRNMGFSNNTWERNAAFIGFDLFPDEANLDIIVRGLEDSNGIIRDRALSALRRLAPVSRTAGTILANFEQNHKKGESLIEMITSVGEHNLLRELANSLASPDLEKRSEAASEIVKSRDKAFISCVAKRLPDETDPDIASKLGDFLADAADPDLIPLFRNLLHHQRSEMREIAVDALSKFESPEIKEMIIERTCDPSQTVRDRSLVALRRMDRNLALERMGDICETGTDDDKKSAILALSNLDDNGAVGLLEKLANDGNLDVREDAVASLKMAAAKGNAAARTLVNDAGNAPLDIYDAISGQENEEIISTFNRECDNYGMRRLIGAGGMGKVFEGYEKSTQKKVAVKIMYPQLARNPIMLARFNREAEARFRHRNIVEMFDSGSMGDIYYLIMEFVEGESLQTLLNRERKLDIRKGLSIIRQVCQGFAGAHSAGCYHRDVKPENILLTPDGTPKISDFGLMKTIDHSTVTSSGTVLGTPYYIPPEQAKGLPADHRSDIYSIGVIMFRMFTGRVPFSGGSPVAVAQMHINRSFPSAARINPHLPIGIEHMIDTATSKAPDDRYQSVLDLIEDINAFLEGKPLKSIKQDNGPMTDVDERMSLVSTRSMIAVFKELETWQKVIMFLSVSLAATGIVLGFMY